MAKSVFENLQVVQEAEALADAVWTMVAGREPFAKRTVGSQLVRAADSVGANIVEGVGRVSRADNARFVRIAQGSLYEVKCLAAPRPSPRSADGSPNARSQNTIDLLLPLVGGYHRSLKRNA